MKLGSNNLANRALSSMEFSTLKVGHKIAGNTGLTIGKTLGKILYKSGDYFGGEIVQAISTSISSNVIDDGLYWIFD